MMKTIAVTGSIGSGKSQVIKILAQKYQVIDCDQIAYELMQEGEAGHLAVKEAFSDLLIQDQLDRSRLAQHVFNHDEDLKRLEGILHPLILEEVLKRLETYQNEKYVFVEVPLLFEVDWQKYFDLSVVVYTKKKILYHRLQALRQMSKQDVDQRLSKQLPVEKKRKLADYVINNDDTLQTLNIKVWEFVDWLDQKA